MCVSLCVRVCERDSVCGGLWCYVCVSVSSDSFVWMEALLDFRSCRADFLQYLERHPYHESSSERRPGATWSHYHRVASEHSRRSALSPLLLPSLPPWPYHSHCDRCDHLTILPVRNGKASDEFWKIAWGSFRIHAQNWFCTSPTVPCSYPNFVPNFHKIVKWYMVLSARSNIRIQFSVGCSSIPRSV
jgi:hypothetical protein